MCIYNECIPFKSKEILICDISAYSALWVANFERFVYILNIYHTFGWVIECGCDSYVHKPKREREREKKVYESAVLSMQSGIQI